MKMFKRVLSLVLAFALIITSITVADTTKTMAAEGVDIATAASADDSDAFIITSVEGLEKFVEFINAGANFEGKTVTLANDIYVQGETQILNDKYEVVADEASLKTIECGGSVTTDKPFCGTLDGAGHTIYGLYIHGGVGKGIGLIGYAKNATIKNLGLVDGFLRTIPESVSRVGLLVGLGENLTMDNCYFIGRVDAFTDGDFTVNSGMGGAEYDGGLVGRLDSGVVSNCIGRGYVAGFQNIGLIVGKNRGTVENCYAIDGLIMSVESSMGAICYCDGGTATGMEVDGIGGLTAGATTVTAEEILAVIKNDSYTAAAAKFDANNAPAEPENPDDGQGEGTTVEPTKPATTKTTYKIVTKSGKKYVVTNKGKAVAKKFVTIKGKKYYAGKKGLLAVKKIVTVKSKKYYAQKNGVIAVKKTVKVAGKSYKADKNGVLTLIKK